jgi:hypothetical protein
MLKKSKCALQYHGIKCGNKAGLNKQTKYKIVMLLYLARYDGNVDMQCLIVIQLQMCRSGSIIEV